MRAYHGTQPGLAAPRNPRRGTAFLVIPLLVLVPLIVAVLSASCATKPPVIPEGLGSSEIIQKAQERMDAYDWAGARHYYKALLDRFGNDPELAATALYELAFIDYRQGRIEEARRGFNAVIAKYAEPGGESIPQTWKILAEKLLAKLPPAPGK